MSPFLWRKMPVLPLFLVCFLLLAAAGGGKAVPGSNFPHDIHVSQVECGTCHQLDGKTALYGKPEKEACVECHEDEIPDYKTGSESPRQSLKITFSHKGHTALDCAACHGDLEKGRAKFPGSGDCSACHKSRKVTTSCKQCHETPRFRPAYHAGRWEKEHGRSADRSVSSRHGWDCSTCHPGSSCAACHRQTKPESHNAFFRLRGHGMKAEFDRESCTMCHQESYCTRCHQQTKPVNHRGDWASLHGFAIPDGKSGALGNCSVCHQPSWCAACHNSASKRKP